MASVADRDTEATPDDSLPIGGQTAVTDDTPPAEGARSRWAAGPDWPTVIWIGALHVGALAAPFFFTWKAVALLFFLGWVSGGIGICLGYHRLLTHGSFQTYRFMRRLIG